MEAIQACDFPALWAGLINNGELDKVVSLYDEHSVLMPTFSPHLVKDTEGLTGYFNQLASREALNVRLHENTIVCTKVDTKSYAINGIYSFEFMVDGTLLTFPSRFTFVVDLSKDSPILHHHSSQIPRTLA